MPTAVGVWYYQGPSLHSNPSDENTDDTLYVHSHLGKCYKIKPQNTHEMKALQYMHAKFLYLARTFSCVIPTCREQIWWIYPSNIQYIHYNYELPNEMIYHYRDCNLTDRIHSWKTHMNGHMDNLESMAQVPHTPAVGVGYYKILDQNPHEPLATDPPNDMP
ncbi:hypothetical protein BS47DRAFT_1367011 [Hydnum rufescens UP504]|uniref:Uncharacterized protein n=1 Tax=Hydnum rufescens UP504 TaxID=1448309 RepID=A0A9P6AKG9_9AGAM|nr:hypothetical protein BS47DRAFT_1367011 [Hydnum rufescens UP504]